MRSRASFSTEIAITFAALSLALASRPASAAWTIEARPLEKKPYGRIVAPIISLDAGGRAQIEGSGITVVDGRTEAFRVALPETQGKRQLEMQLGYVTMDAKYDPAAACDVTLEIGGAKETVRVPLRSLHPAGEPREKLMSFDWIAPAITKPVSSGATELTVAAARGPSCDKGVVVLLDPKVWVTREGDAKRLVFMVADSVNGDWWEEGRSFTPSLTRFFADPEHGTFATNVFSVGTNTFDTTRILGTMQWGMRDTRILKPRQKVVTGLVPTLLGAGYDAVSFSGNALLSTLLDHFGFRTLYAMDPHGTENNEREWEISLGMTANWLVRHPDHDAFAFAWTGTTHTHGSAPEHRPDLDLSRMPFAKDFPWNLENITLQAKSLSYFDIVVERFFALPVVKDSDVFFFSDHGVNFDRFEHPGPDWGSCTGQPRGYNAMLFPRETRIPIGVRLRGGKIPRPTVETSLIDWVKTVVTRHNPALDVSTWEGEAVENVSESTPRMIAGHIQRGAMRLGGRQAYFSELVCREGEGGFFVDDDGKPLEPGMLRSVVRELDRRNMVAYRRFDLEVVRGIAPCEITLSGAAALGEDNVFVEGKAITPAAWLSREHLYVPELVGVREGRDVVVSASPPGCAVVQVGMLKRTVNGRLGLGEAGLTTFLGGVDEPLAPETRTVVRITSEPDRFVRGAAGGFQSISSGRKQDDKAGKSVELRDAMKRWGYIQDDPKK